MRYSYTIFPVTLLLTSAQVSSSDIQLKDLINELDISPYANLKIAATYSNKQEKAPERSDGSTQQWQLKDNASKAGIKFNYPVAQSKIYGRYELGTNANSDDTPFFKTRQAYLGVRTQWGKLQYGQQNAIVKNYDNFDRSHRVGASVHLTKDELNTKRPSHTMQYHTRFDEFRLSGQYNFSRTLENRPQLRIGSQRLRVKDTKLDYGVGLGIHYTGLKNIELEAGYQASYYEQAKYHTHIASAKWQASSNLQVSIYGATHSLKDLQKSKTAKSRHYALGARYRLFDQHRIYGSLEYAYGANDIKGAKQRALVIGNDYRFASQKHAYVEIRKRYFDADKADDINVALGINIKF